MSQDNNQSDSHALFDDTIQINPRLRIIKAGDTVQFYDHILSKAFQETVVEKIDTSNKNCPLGLDTFEYHGILHHPGAKISITQYLCDDGTTVQVDHKNRVTLYLHEFELIDG